MASLRLYFPSSAGSPGISPTPDAGWTRTADMVRRQAVDTRVSSAMATVTSASASTTGNILLAQYVYGPVATGFTISGTVKGQIRASESDASADARAQIGIRVIAGDGSTVRGTALALDAAALSSEFGTAPQNRKFPRGGAVALTSVAGSAGDYIVIELGARKHQSNFATASLSLGDNSGTDLPEDETTFTANNPWIEISSFSTSVSASGTISVGGFTIPTRSLGGSVSVSGTASVGIVSAPTRALTGRVAQTAALGVGAASLPGQSLVGRAAPVATLLADVGITLDDQSLLATAENAGESLAVLVRGLITAAGQVATIRAASSATLTILLQLINGQALSGASAGASAGLTPDDGIALTGWVLSGAFASVAVFGVVAQGVSGTALSARADTAAEMASGQFTLAGSAVGSRVGFRYTTIWLV